MNKKILLLSAIYPAPDLKYGTPCVHYFAKEWASMGYEVRVVHFQATYPKIFYLLARIFRDRIASSTGAVVFTEREEEDKSYTMDEVTIHRFPIFKWIPHGRYGRKLILKQVKKIVAINDHDGFQPSIIVGHFSNPQLKVISELKEIYQARTCMIMHDDGSSIIKTYKSEYKTLMKDIDIWGYRSRPIKTGFEKTFGSPRESFYCYSGIPERFISDVKSRSFCGDVKSFVYVGEFIKRKYAISVIPAVNAVYAHKDYKISFVGSGAELRKIRSLTEELSLSKNISILGYVPREELINILDDADCMIMISEGEAFGLVYLEAMARGCITIGSLNEGIDGVIEHGVNGFLCEAGSVECLTKVILHINTLSSFQKLEISQNAIKTAKGLTDNMAAHKYISALDR